MIFILNYANPIFTKENYTLSIDNVVINFVFTDSDAYEGLLVLLFTLSDATCKSWTSIKCGNYHDQHKIVMHDETSFWLGVGLNRGTTNWKKCRIDFNPNKVAEHKAFQEILNYLITHTVPEHRKVKRFDLAIDIPVQRNDVFLTKDRRIYTEYRQGQSWTQYLGRKSHAGYVKLYNKQYESNLPRPLTRLELTIDPSKPYEKLGFPKVTYLDDLQMVFEDLKLTDTDHFILNALIHGTGTVKDLGRRMRQKMQMLVDSYVRRVEISREDYSAVLQQLYSYIREPLRSAA